MRKTLLTVTCIGFGLALVGCNNKAIDLDKDKVVVFDPKRDNNVTVGGGPGGGNAAEGGGTMTGKKKLPPGK